MKSVWNTKTLILIKENVTEIDPSLFCQMFTTNKYEFRPFFDIFSPLIKKGLRILSCRQTKHEGHLMPMFKLIFGNDYESNSSFNKVTSQVELESPQSVIKQMTHSKYTLST